MAFLCNAFNDPSNPWYYVIGVVFLLVVFGALAAYIILTGKKGKGKDGQTEEQKSKTENASKDEAHPDEAVEQNAETKQE